MTERETSDWQPTARLEMLRQRHELFRTIRQFFDRLGFLEVETPLLSRDTVVDRHIEPMAVAPPPGWRNSLGHQPAELFLQTSPEFCMKRLLAAGSGPIYQICKAFRGGELGPLHNPEFTMLEWYHPGLDYAAGREQLAGFAQAIFAGPPAEEIPFRSAFSAASGLDPFTAELAALREAAGRAGFDGPTLAGLDRDGLIDCILAGLVQPALGHARPAIVFDWPTSQSALACVNRCNGHPVAERFELFVRGTELANGYHELLDADELVQRMESANQWRRADGHRELPTQSHLVQAMRHGMPAGCGVAVGLDRLLMVRHDVQSISEVLSFTAERA